MIWRVLSIGSLAQQILCRSAGSSDAAGLSQTFDASRYRNHDEKQINNAFVPERGHFLILIAADQSNRFIHPRVPMKADIRGAKHHVRYGPIANNHVGGIGLR